MSFYVTNQNIVVIVLFLFGTVCGLFRDLITVKRYFVRTTSIVAFFEDLLYCLVLTIIYHITVFVTNYGYVRWYEFASLFAGFATYRVTLSKIVLFVFQTVISAISGFVIKVLGILLRPIYRLLNLMWKRIEKLGLKAGRYYNRKIMIIRSKRVQRKYLKLSQNGF